MHENCSSNRGVAVRSSGASYIAYGGDFYVADEASYTIGVQGYTRTGVVTSMAVEAETRANATENYGVFARALPSTTDPRRFIGIKGEANAVNSGQTAKGIWGVAPASNGTNSFAAYFQGDGFITNLPWYSSDESLKQNIVELDPIEMTEKLMQLSPKAYNFNITDFPYLNLSNRPQLGLIAQEVEAIFPDLVREIVHHQTVDSSGAIVTPEVTFKAIQYDALIPVLIAGHKEQQATITEQQTEIAALTEQAVANQGAVQELQELRDRMDQIEQLLAACCQNPDGGTRDLINDNTGLNHQDGDRNLRIQPNPFNEQTTVDYTLERSGRMQLMANSSDGKQLRVLHEAQMEAGEYQYEWQTADLSAGIYYVTLLLDGEPIVKKAVKVN